MKPYVLSIRRLSIFFVVLSDLMEVVFIQLPHKTGKIAVFEVFWKDGLGKFLALR
jgi:hypothetical protein